MITKELRRKVIVSNVAWTARGDNTEGSCTGNLMFHSGSDTSYSDVWI